MKKKEKINLSLGLVNLKYSATFLLIITIFLLLFFIFLKYTLLQILSIGLKAPKDQDYLVIFAGFILFIVVPFVLGLKKSGIFKK